MVEPISLTAGVYVPVGFVKLEKVPAYVPDQVPLVAEPPIEPPKLIAAIPQVEISVPAFTVAGALMVIFTVSEAAEHAPVAFVVHVKVMVEPLSDKSGV